MAKALFEVDHDNGEATGAVFHFCSDACRAEFERLSNLALDAGDSEPINHAQCDSCGLLLK